MKYISYVLVPCLMVSSFLFTSCEQDGTGIHLETPDGAPVVDYIRLADPAVSDSLISSATLGTGIVIVGKNLGGTRAVLFNDKEAELAPTWVTNSTVFADIPSASPAKVTDMLYLVGANGDTLKVPFKVAIPEPQPLAALNEWPLEGENLVILGDYFFAPLSVTFTGGVKGEVVSVSQNRVEVTVPEGAAEGPVTVATNFGVSESIFHVWDQRNIILNYDDPGKTPTGAWRNGIFVNDENSIDGNYIMFEGVYNAGERTEGEGSPYESQFWAQVSGRTEPTMLPGQPTDYVMKFEANVVEWFGSHLNICFAPYDHNQSNQEIWSNNFNARAVWGPWEDAGETFSTNGQWITVTIPITEFRWAMGTNAEGNVVYSDKLFDPSVTGSLSFWVLSSAEADNSPFKFYLDNIRIVPAK